MAACLPNRAVLEAYRQWLHYEARFCAMELYPELGARAERYIPETFASNFHFPPAKDWREVAKPSTRALTVLQAVGLLPEDPPATEDQWASMEFEPWKHEPGEWGPPSNKEWADMTNPYLISIRLAWITLYKTKPELIDIIDRMESEVGIEFLESIEATLQFFKGIVMILEAAEVRFLCAGATLLARDSQKMNSLQ
ncbi:hypothetical protein OIU35_05905 [Boseaceae bacterium BT-24-1]|nr:hypothetical protein [Boseaceae bacterium BT-24-1]